MRVRLLRRRARLLFVPAFTVSYHFGEHFNVHGVRRPETFQAVIGGATGSSVAAERHYSPAKVTTHLPVPFKANPELEGFLSFITV